MINHGVGVHPLEVEIEKDCIFALYSFSEYLKCIAIHKLDLDPEEAESLATKEVLVLIKEKTVWSKFFEKSKVLQDSPPWVIDEAAFLHAWSFLALHLYKGDAKQGLIDYFKQILDIYN